MLRKKDHRESKAQPGLSHSPWSSVGPSTHSQPTANAQVSLENAIENRKITQLTPTQTAEPKSFVAHKFLILSKSYIKALNFGLHKLK